MLIVNSFLTAQCALRLKISKPMTLNTEAQEAAHMIVLTDLEKAQQEACITMKAEKQKLKGNQ